MTIVLVLESGNKVTLENVYSVNGNNGYYQILYKSNDSRANEMQCGTWNMNDVNIIKII